MFKIFKIRNVKTSKYVKEKNKNLTHDGYRKYSTISSWDIDNWKKKNPEKFSNFIKQGGMLGGVYDMSDKNTRKFVEENKEYIHKSELWYR